MTRRTPIVVALLLLVLLGAGWPRIGVAAPRPAAEKSRFYDFDDLLVDGEFNKPTTIYTRALKSPRFDRLLRLQKSFLDQLGRTTRDPGLRWFR